LNEPLGEQLVFEEQNVARPHHDATKVLKPPVTAPTLERGVVVV
jgi:hypothetical protein